MAQLCCAGSVSTLRYQNVLFTGRTLVDGEWMIKEDCRLMVERRGGICAPDRSRSVTLLVLGDLSTQRVVDPVNLRSQKAIFAQEQRGFGNHICVVDSYGFSRLLRGNPADCLPLLRVDASNVRALPRSLRV